MTASHLSCLFVEVSGWCCNWRVVGPQLGKSHAALRPDEQQQAHCLPGLLMGRLLQWLARANGAPKPGLGKPNGQRAARPVHLCDTIARQRLTNKGLQSACSVLFLKTNSSIRAAAFPSCLGRAATVIDAGDPTPLTTRREGSWECRNGDADSEPRCHPQRRAHLHDSGSGRI